VRLQEVTSQRLNTIQNYTAYINTGSELRGTAILTKFGISLNNKKRLPNGRGIAVLFQNTWIINVYAHSGTEKRDDRERFYTIDISLLPITRSAIILAGDFNCVLRQIDATGRKNFSRALDALVTGLHLHDVYEHNKTNPPPTHYTTSGVTRIDRIYITENIQSKKRASKLEQLLLRIILQLSSE
jgi:exonuclease III